MNAKNILKTFRKVLAYIYINNPKSLFPIFLLKGISYQIFKRLFRQTISINIFNLKKIFLFPNCHISTLFAYTKIPDYAQINLLRKLVDSNTIFLDIGANVGSHSIMLMDRAKEVYAFEPNPFIANRCKMNFLLNNYSEDRVINAAIGSEIKTALLTDDRDNSTVNKIMNDHSGSFVLVDMDTLDNFAAKNLNVNNEYVLKIDTEGYELQVFEGASNFLNNYNVKGIVFECDQNEAAFEFLKKIGFNIKKIDSEGNYFAFKK